MSKRKEEKGNPNDKCARKARVNPAGVAWAGQEGISMTLEHGDSGIQHISATALYPTHLLVNREIMNLP